MNRSINNLNSNKSPKTMQITNNKYITKENKKLINYSIQNIEIKFNNNSNMIKRNISIKRKNSKIYAPRSCQAIFFYILTTLLISIWSIKYEYFIFNSKYSYITLKVAALKDIKIFSSYTYPDEIYINGINQTEIKNIYNFSNLDEEV